MVLIVTVVKDSDKDGEPEYLRVQSDGKDSDYGEQDKEDND